MRYFTQGLAEGDPGRKDLPLDIATEELSHLEVVGSLVVMLNKGVKSQMAEGIGAAELMANITGGTDSHATALLYSGGVALTNSAGVPWTAAYVDSRSEPTADFRSNIAAEARAKIPRNRASEELREGSLRDRGPTSPGKLPGQPEFTDKYFNMSQGEGDMRGPWNQGEPWEFVADREQQAAVDGGDGSASVKLTREDQALEKKMMKRMLSDPASDPTTGADLGASPAAGKIKSRA